MVENIVPRAVLNQVEKEVAKNAAKKGAEQLALPAPKKLPLLPAPIAGEVVQDVISIDHPVINNIRTGSALKSDPHHAFPDIVDNFAKQAEKFSLKGDDNILRELYQVEGSLNGQGGIFEWIVDPRLDFGITHRMFIKNGKITGKPNAFVRT